MTKKDVLKRAVIIAEGTDQRKEQLRQNLVNVIKFSIAVAKFATHDRELIVEATVQALLEQGIRQSELEIYYDKYSS
jgi:hypothetical protein